MRLPTVVLALLLGVVAGACAEEEDLGTFACGDEDCDVRSEICVIDDQCDGTMGARSCQAAPDACDGRRTTLACVSEGGLGCSEGAEGGFSCSPSCG